MELELRLGLERCTHSMLSEFNRLIVDVLEVPESALQRWGPSMLSIALFERMQEITPATPGLASKLAAARADFHALCESAPHIPLDALEAIAAGYGALSLFIELDAPTDVSEAYGLLMSVAMSMGAALAHASAGQHASAARAERFLKDARARLSAMGTDARHGHNRKRKARLKAWYLANKCNYRTDDLAATAVSQEASVAWRTAREWITEWKREVRSAGRP